MTENVRDDRDDRDAWRVGVVGECLISRPFSMHGETMGGIKDILESSDLAYGHLEMNFGDFNTIGWPARGDWIGSYMLSDPAIASDLRWLGLDVLSTAQNHSFDFGAEGVRSTLAHIRDAGMGAAGTGEDLEEAREPCYWETSRGRVALVSASSGNRAHEWASLSKGGMRGRPGVNPQRVYTKYLVDPDQAQRIRDVGRQLGILREPGMTVEGSSGPVMTDGQFTLAMPGDQSSRGAAIFEESDRTEIVTTCHERDLRGNLRSVAEAREMADLVMVAHHFNISEGSRGDVAPGFVKEFARACVDGGADVYLGHGWHKTLGIEIYRGRPIFYGLGNFFAQSEFIRRVPYDSYETWGHDVERLPTLRPSDHPLHPGVGRISQTWWSSALIQMDIDSAGEVQEIRLHPVELGRDQDEVTTLRRRTGKGEQPLTEGRPVLARGANAERILARIVRLSEELGTKVTIEDGIGVIRVSDQ